MMKKGKFIFNDAYFVEREKKQKEIYKKMILRESIFLVKIAWMKYYQWEVDDIPFGGFEFIRKDMEYDDNGVAGLSENQNFIKFGISRNCFGCFQYKETKKGSQIYRKPRLERIEGNERNKNCESVDDILVIFCATNPNSEKNRTNVIGWYANATVFRQWQYDEDYEIYYNIFAESKNCILLPVEEREKKIWDLPQIPKNGINFGQSTFIYPKKSNPVLQEVLKAIANYDGENWYGEFRQEF